MNIIRETYLKADSQKQAFYKLVTERITDGYVIIKESGVGEGKVLHKETYFRKSLTDALKFHEKKIKEKTGSHRKRAYFIMFDKDRMKTAA